MIRTEHLGCGYGRCEVLHDITITMNPGELWCVLGANGVGKSTLFKTLLGLLKPMSGQILIQDKPLEQWSRKELSRLVAYVPQNHVPPFPFKVWEMVAMGRNPYQNGYGRMTPEDSRIVAEAMGTLHIDGLANKIYTQISGGERQLVLLARAIAQQTPALFLDEPVSNLDFGNHARVLSHVRRLAAGGKTIVMTTHCPDHAFMPESSVILLDRGGVLGVGKGTEIVTEERIRYMYDIGSRIVEVDPEGRMTCIADY